ncbi:MAG: type I secretion system permease/ATPase [Bdellovibrionales bacterium]
MAKQTPENSNTDDKGALNADSVDPLLECLVFLTAHYGRAKSAQALTAGLAYDEHDMSPALFCEAAGRLGLKTQIVKKQSLKAIPQSVCPLVLILEGEHACVLLEKSAKTAKVFLPETKETKDVDAAELSDDFSGYAIYIHPRAEFTNPLTAEDNDANRHWFWSIVNENKGVYGLVLLGSVFINLFGLVSPVFIMNVYNRVIPYNAIETGWALGLGALAVFVFDFIMRNLRGYLIDFSGRKIDVIAGRRIYDQVLNMKLAGRPKSSGSFASMLHDFTSVREFFTSATITGLVDLPFTVFFLFVVYQIGGGLAFVLAALIAVVFALGMVLQIPLKSLVRKAAKSSEARHGLLVETIHGLETLKAIGADGRFRARYGNYIAENAALGQSSRFVSALGVNIAAFCQQTASIIVVLLGMYLVKDGDLSVGGLIACVLLGGRAIAPIGQIASLVTKYHQAGGALKTLEGIMRKPVERPPHQQFLHRPDLKGNLSFDKVSFAYPDTAREVLHNVSFHIKAGEKVGIIGRIGSGKSTIARLLLGLYDPSAGSLLADETDYRQIDPADLRRNVAYIAQDVVLFSGSVRDNIAAGAPHAAEEEILHAAKLAGVHHFIARHPMGYDAPVGEHGNSLSGGQRQAIALARAMLLKPKVIVADEPTNAMDMQAEAAFKAYVQKEIIGKTFILITHKHNMLDMVDRLILLDQGKLIMDGPRDKVIAALQSGKVEVPG